MMAEMLIVKPGLLTTVQDLGRYGHQASGVPVAGPMDSFSHRLANLLAGNGANARMTRSFFMLLSSEKCRPAEG